MYSIRATGHGRTATEPAGTDPDRADTLARRTAGLRDVDTTELLSPSGEVISTYHDRKEHHHDPRRVPPRELLRVHAGPPHRQLPQVTAHHQEGTR